jgi:hypothetical protein
VGTNTTSAKTMVLGTLPRTAHRGRRRGDVWELTPPWQQLRNWGTLPCMAHGGRRRGDVWELTPPRQQPRKGAVLGNTASHSARREETRRCVGTNTTSATVERGKTQREGTRQCGGLTLPRQQQPWKAPPCTTQRAEENEAACGGYTASYSDRLCGGWGATKKNVNVGQRTFRVTVDRKTHYDGDENSLSSSRAHILREGGKTVRCSVVYRGADMVSRRVVRSLSFAHIPQ